MSELYHHGVKGQKWGVRRYQNKDGSLIIRKGYKLKRVSTSRDDPVYDNKKYLSINDADHKKWDDYIGGAYAREGYATYSQTYEAQKELRIMSTKKQGELYTKKLMDSEFADMAVKDLDKANSMLGTKATDDPAENISRMMAMQTETGKKFVTEVLSRNYDGVVDKHGMNVADWPIIVFNPNENLKRTKTEYTDAVKRYYS